MWLCGLSRAAKNPQIKYARLRGTPGSGADKLAEAEREVAEAETRVKDSRIRWAFVCGGGCSRGQVRRGLALGVVKHLSLCAIS